MEERKLLVLLVSLGILAIIFLPITFAVVQKSFIFDTDTYVPLFLSEENAFNDTTTSKQVDYSSLGNYTYFVNLPRNSSIINITINLTGNIVYVYSTQVITSGLQGISLGDISSDGDNEIAVGSQGNDGYVRTLHGENGSSSWTTLIQVNNEVFTTSIGEANSSSSGNEIAVGSEDDYVYILSSGGSILWSNSTGGDVKVVLIDDIHGEGTNKILVGSDDLYVFNDDLTYNWTKNLPYAINDIAVGNLTDDYGNETVVGCNSGYVYIINSSGNITQTFNLGTSAINTVDVGNVTTSADNEIVVGFASPTNNISVIDATGNYIWNYTAGNAINSVKVGNVTAEYDGNEVVAGSNDQNVYTLDKDGGLIWSFQAASFVNSISIGNLTSDEGNEVVAGAGDGYLYIFNFDYFPLNVSIDSDGDGEYEWNKSGKLRTTETAFGFESNLQSALDTCVPDSDNTCNLSLTFQSYSYGRLNVSFLNVTYDYNLTDITNFVTIGTWSRTTNILTNESVGNTTRDVSFTNNPSFNVSVQYLRINQSATRCDFNGTNYTTTTVGGILVCDVPDFIIPNSGPTPNFYMWDDNMTTDVPVIKHEFSPYYTSGPYNNFWKKNITITNSDSATLFNITINTTVDDSGARENVSLSLIWKGSWCNVTPSSFDTNCDTSSPTFQTLTCSSDPFFVCMKDTNSNDVPDFFKWVQPFSNTTVNYQAIGVSNLAPNLTQNGVEPTSGSWGSYFNFSIYVNDTENDTVVVRLWVYVNLTDDWRMMNESNITNNDTLWFNITLDNTFTGLSRYKFEYQDWNTTQGIPMHDFQNTSEFSGPEILKREVQIEHEYGNESFINRSGSQTGLLSVRILDLVNSSYVGSGVSCRFWITTNSSTYYDSGTSNTTNSTGYCNYYFNPDGNYTAENQTWYAGTYQDSYYPENDTNNASISLKLAVRGELSIIYENPYVNKTLLRNDNNNLEAKLIDEYSNEVSLSGMECTFWFDGSELGTDTTNSSGDCEYAYNPACGVNLGNFNITVNISGSDQFYNLNNYIYNRTVNMKDILFVNITSPLSAVSYNKGDSFNLNSTSNDSCKDSSGSDYNINWYSMWKKGLKVQVLENRGLHIKNYLVVINGTDLEEENIELSEWDVNSTWVYYNGQSIKADVKTWTNGSRIEFNESIEYLNNYSDIVFAVNLTANQSHEFYIYYNSSKSEDENITYILNGGFESNTTFQWSSEQNCLALDKCLCENKNEGTEPYGNYSLYLTGKGVSSSQAVGARFNSSGNLSTDYMKVVFKTDTTLDSGAYLRVYAGNGMCEFNSTNSVINVWNNGTCYHPSFSEAGFVNVTLHSTGQRVINVHIDYICLADSSGECISYDSGHVYFRNITSEDLIGSQENVTWAIPGNQSVGKIKLLVNASGDNYIPGTNYTFAYVYGWSNVSYISFYSRYCTYNATNQSYDCMVDANITVECTVLDANGSQPIMNYNVSFYHNNTYIGYNYTNSSGIASLFWENSSDAEGWNNVTCNISDQEDIYYNITAENNASAYFNATTGTTTGLVYVNPNYINASNVTKGYNHTFDLNITIENTGLLSMYDTTVTIYVQTGIFATSVIVPPLSPGEVYNVTSDVNVTYNASLGNQTLETMVIWTNADTSIGNMSNQTYVHVDNSSVINVIESEITYSMPVSVERNVGNFTIENYGNTPLVNITFTESGDNASDVHSWIEYTPSSVSSLSTNGVQEILVNITLPSDATTGEYYANLTVNASNTTCNPDSNCWDYVVLNLTVEPYDWTRTPESMTRTVGVNAENGTLGIITVTNNKNEDYSFDVYTEGNASDYISLDKTYFVVPVGSSEYVYVYYNTTYASVEEDYGYNITLVNQNDTVPDQLNTSAYLKIIKMNLNLLSPNTSNAHYDVNASDTISISANLTLSDNPLTENVTWSVKISGYDCTGLQAGYNSSSTLWVLNCTAPSITGNIINNSINLSVYYSTSNYFISDDEINAVNYRDITPPQFPSFSLSGTDSDGYINWSDSVANIYATVNVTDNYQVSSVWANITFPNGTSYLFGMTYSGGFWILNTPNPNDIGDYKIDVFGNDSSGLTNSTTGTETGFFDVYRNIMLMQHVKTKNNQPMVSNITLFKPGTSWQMQKINSNSSGNFNHSIHNRAYDMMIETKNQTVILYSANISSSATTQHVNESLPFNITDPLRFDYFDNRDVADIGNLDLPSTADNVVMVFVIEAPNLTYSSGNITLNYTEGLSFGGIAFQENKFEILYCTSWNYQTRVCSSTFEYLDLDINPDVVNNEFTFTASPSTAYALAEYTAATGNGGDPIIINTGGGGGSSSTSVPVTKVCGNGICESGENEINCPADCLPYPFTIQTGLSDIKMQPGENRTFNITITNLLSKTINVTIKIENLEEYIKLGRSNVILESKNSTSFNAVVNVSKNTSTGLYTGYLAVSAENKTNRIPINLRIGISGESIVKLSLDLITQTVSPTGELKFIVDLENVGFFETFNATVEYYIKSTSTESIVKKENETVFVSDRVSLIKSISLGDVIPPDGEYFIEVWALVDEYFVKDIETFYVTTSFFATWMGQALVWIIAISAIAGTAYYFRNRYITWLKGRTRYIFPTDFRKLPQKSDESFWIGRIAETKRDAYYNPLDLKTHILTAGATGAGKSVSASVIVEEALDRNIAVIAFDPTAQWTGFVKPCSDENLLRHYESFGMNKREAHSYRGNIFEVTDPQDVLFRLKKDLKKFMIPGEITVFTLDKLKPGQYDEAVNNIISVFFSQTLEESAELKMIMVFDEVHRLLEKYGGKGGYISLEKACREFRKWGIGLIMCSQVLSDFKEAISGNVLTDIQLNTKSITDIQKVQSKYGQMYAERISRQGVGVGMIQHPKYNDGKPYFVNFRPTYHNPHKITNEEMDIYRDFMKRLDMIEEMMHKMKKKGEDISDMELEFKLTNNKLKQGEFRLAKIYINSLEERLGIKKGG